MAIARTSLQGCENLVKVCANLQPNESALIISDSQTKELGDQLKQVVSQITQNSIHKVIQVAEMHGKEPSADVALLMKNADVIFGITKMSMAHTQARFDATARGARYLSLPDYSDDLLRREALFVDFREITPLADRLANVLTQGKKIKLTTMLGTSLNLNIAGRIGNSAPGWCYAKGTLASPPDAEANIPPLEDATEGVLIIDGSIPCQELGLLSEPIKLVMSRGQIIAIEGGNQAQILENIFKKYDTPLVKVAAEFGIGLNPSAELIGSMLEDEGCLGTVHIGFGSNSTIGGCNKVPFHLDTIIRQATIHVDDVMIMYNGDLMPLVTLENESVV